VAAAEVLHERMPGGDSSSPTSGFGYASYKLTSSCSGTIKLFTPVHFFELSTNTWWMSGWIKPGPSPSQTGPFSIPGT
jgi:hypothetical protein